MFSKKKYQYFLGFVKLLKKNQEENEAGGNTLLDKLTEFVKKSALNKIDDNDNNELVKRDDETNDDDNDKLVKKDDENYNDENDDEVTKRFGLKKVDDENQEPNNEDELSKR